MPRHILSPNAMDRAFSPRPYLRQQTQGVALGWYGGGPLALGSAPTAHTIGLPSTRERRSPSDGCPHGNRAPSRTL
ncbi:MAG: hypothetical protein JJT96_08905, partial [Opitutales bacterium]|nr:hypothetical protein [Opitutales bacterium]